MEVFGDGRGPACQRHEDGGGSSSGGASSGEGDTSGRGAAGPGRGGIHGNGNGNGNGVFALQSTVLLLNRHYLPVHVTSAKRAFVLFYKGDAEAISLQNERIVAFDFAGWIRYSTDWPGEEDDDYVATVALRIRVPRVLRLLDYERLPAGRVNFTRKNVLARDEYRCQYCGVRAGARELTLDHVIPRSRGGKHCWVNVVACCYRCNDRKGRMTPREAGMHLLREPVAPKRSPELKRKLEDRKYRVWRTFLS
jgi:5-methylcytosine-specific restriction endonuclease McrA